MSDATRVGEFMRRFGTVLSVLAAMVGATAAAAPAAAAGTDILAQLRAVPGLTVVEERPVAEPYRFFVLTYTQPADHRRPKAGTFAQRMTLLHRDATRPMILHTTGYGVPAQPFRAEPTRLVDGNQLSVEQRYFEPSRPEPADWAKQLTIWQAATDHHRVVGALDDIYPAAWLSTGASKGGMTSVYHRRFYPSDVDGTVAYVAPQDVVNREDSAYDRFFATVGTDPACRAALDAVQAEALRRRAALVGRYQAWAAENGRTFTVLHSADRAFEFMVNGAPWAFWQYSDQSRCGEVPPVTASDDAIFGWLDAVFGLDSNTDQGIGGFVPYYYQAAYQLGYPFLKLRHLAKLQRYRGQDVAKSYVPAELDPHFRPAAMDDIDRWVRHSGRELLLVYGENDPWGAEPFRPGRGTRDSLWFTAPGANHGASIARLTTGDAATATAAVQRWAGVAAASLRTAAPAVPYEPSLDDYNPALDRSLNR
jgi:hypothetical protein